MTVLFQVSLFVSAFLLFWLQLFVAKMLLPRFGGVPAVWNTCLVFFQAGLLVGYAYAHGSSVWLAPKRQTALHMILLLVPLAVLPVTVSTALPDRGSPIPTLLGLLTVSIGLPFVMVASTAPLLQRWFASTGNAGARDPYFLYAASNAGSLLGLLAYPFFIEPVLNLGSQSVVWLGGYLILSALTLACAVIVWGTSRAPKPATNEILGKLDRPEMLTTQLRLFWIALAFVPSSLLLSVTTILTSEVAPVPLLWVAPLSVYLVTYILAFTSRAVRLKLAAAWLAPGAALLLLLLLPKLGGLSLRLLCYLTSFFVIALACHSELARRRPAARHLTEFYLWLAVGGVAGGMFNALLAPWIFPGMWELPIALVLACLLLPSLRPSVPTSARPLRDLTWVAAFGILAGVAFALFPGNVIWVSALACLPLLLWYFRPLRFGLALAMVLALSFGFSLANQRVLAVERNFFGILTVSMSDKGRFHTLLHGVTIHGIQARHKDPSVRCTPLSYYHPTGPVGELFLGLLDGKDLRPIGIIGLGVGSLASFGQPGQEITFFEINPAVERIARNPDFFTFLQESRARCRVVLGDARLSLQDVSGGHFGMLVMDAFNSDAIPMHLLTMEALDLYLAKLHPRGVLAFHITNKYLDLEPVLANLANARGLACWGRADVASKFEEERGKMSSRWVIMARQPSDLRCLAKDPRWHDLSGRAGGRPWTDSYSNLLEVFLATAD
jgi:hypothetical protein